ncbi:hypothetical protein RRG08_029122 [Elysia crispata]|uniref:Uncharacterized protein n=1 Tax=Elysia crispata TaxID=231223 RepID=A0AAE1CTW2_9GAST|nr:hypothetical protein RRG08_029122 [Elysia crispata]
MYQLAPPGAVVDYCLSDSEALPCPFKDAIDTVHPRLSAQLQNRLIEKRNLFSNNIYSSLDSADLNHATQEKS